MVAAAGLGVMCLTLFWIGATRPERLLDLRGVSIGAGRAVHCLEHGRFTGCDRLPDGQMSGASRNGFVMGNVGPWAPLAYFMAMPLRAVGLSAGTTLSVLIMTNAVAFTTLIALSWVLVARRVGREWGPVITVCLLTSPLLWYSTVAFGEVVTALIVSSAVAAVLTRRSPRSLAVVVMLAGIPQVAVLWTPRSWASFFSSRGVCANAAVETNVDRYYRCTSHLAWHTPPLTTKVVGDLRSPVGVLMIGVMALTVAALVVLARDLAGDVMRRRVGRDVRVVRQVAVGDERLYEPEASVS